MEDAPKIKVNPFKSKKNLQLVWRIGILLFVLVLIGFAVEGVLLWRKSRTTDDPSSVDLFEQQKSDADQYLARIEGADEYVKVALVGKEYLFEEDLKTYFSAQGRIEDYEGKPEERDPTIAFLVNQSIALQEGEREGWIELDETFFNNPMKDNRKRSEMLSVVVGGFSDEYAGDISVEGCSVWFYPTNGSPYLDTYGVEAARQKAKEKIDYVYGKVRRNEIDMKQAGDILINDPEVQEMNPGGYNLVAPYDSAAYFEQIYNFQNIGSEQEHNNHVIEQILALSTNEVTDVLTAKSVVIENGTGVTKDAYFVFYKSLDSDRGYKSYGDWIEANKGNYLIEKY